MFRPCVLAFALSALLPSVVNAAPQSDRFAAMDSNGDGKIVIEEFRAAFPNMNEKAFEIIDLDGDKAIEVEEWAQFTSTHGQSGPEPEPHAPPMNNIPGNPIFPPPDSSDLPLMRPPME